jgi:hypothetical protein
MAGERPTKSTREVERLFRGWLLADTLEFCSHRRNFRPSSDLAVFGATARFLRRRHEDQECTNRLLCDPISAFGLRTEFSS